MDNKMTEDFASLGEMIATTQARQNSKYTKDDIQMYLENPTKYANNLRAVSDYYYTSNGIYKNIINTFANLPTLDHMILPSSKTLGKSQDKAYGTYYDKVNAYADSINIKLTTRGILRSVAKYGVYVGYERNESGQVYIQTLPVDFIRIKYKVGNDYQLEFNFKYFDKFFQKDDLDFAFSVYPKEFKKLYNRYKADRKSRTPEWQMLDIKNTICILPDDDNVLFIPTYSGVFESLLSNEEYKDLIKLGQQLEVTKLIVQKVPTDKEGNLTIPRDLVKVFHEELKKILPEGATGLTTPLEIHDVAFTNTSQAKEDLLSKAERGVFVSSGHSSSLYANDGGNIGLNMNVETVTANIYAVLEKIEDMFTKRFKNVVNTKNYDFKLKFFRTTNININDNFERMFKLLSIGGAIQPIFSILGYDLETYTTLLQMENDMGIKDMLTVPQSMHTTTTDASTSDKGAGKPQKQEKNLTDKGVQARNLDSNNKNKRNG